MSRGIRCLARRSEFVGRLTRYLIKRVEWLVLLKGKEEQRESKKKKTKRRVISLSAVVNGTYYLLSGDTATTFKNRPMCSACIEKGSGRWLVDSSRKLDLSWCSGYSSFYLRPWIFIVPPWNNLLILFLPRSRIVTPVIDYQANIEELRIRFGILKFLQVSKISIILTSLESLARQYLTSILNTI